MAAALTPATPAFPHEKAISSVRSSMKTHFLPSDTPAARPMAFPISEPTIVRANGCPAGS